MRGYNFFRGDIKLGDSFSGIEGNWERGNEIRSEIVQYYILYSLEYIIVT